MSYPTSMRRYKHKREGLTKEQANNLQNACKTLRDKLVVWTLLDTGLRVEEFCSLEARNIDWSNHTILVYGKNTTGIGGKKKRIVPMTARVQRLLELWIAESHDNKVGIHVRTAHRIVHRIGHSAMIGNVCPHILRHTFAISSLDRGIPLPSLQKVLGHEDLATTAIYLNQSNAEAVRIYQERF